MKNKIQTAVQAETVRSSAVEVACSSHSRAYQDALGLSPQQVGKMSAAEQVLELIGGASIISKHTCLNRGWETLLQARVRDASLYKDTSGRGTEFCAVVSESQHQAILAMLRAGEYEVVKRSVWP